MDTTQTINEQLLLPEFTLDQRLANLEAEIETELERGNITPRELESNAKYMMKFPLVDPTDTHLTEDELKSKGFSTYALSKRGELSPLERTIAIHTYAVAKVLDAPNLPPDVNHLPTDEKGRNQFALACIQVLEEDVLTKQQAAISQGVHPHMAVEDAYTRERDRISILQNFGMIDRPDPETLELINNVIDTALPIYYAGWRLKNMLDKNYAIGPKSQ